MPDVLRVRYLGDATAVVPLAGGAEVAPDCVFDVPGRLVDEAGDHYLIETGNPAEQRALPRSLYRVETPAKTAAKSAGKES